MKAALLRGLIFTELCALTADFEPSVEEEQSYSQGVTLVERHYRSC